MSILIKGMEMPKGCYCCPLAHRSYNLKENMTQLACYVADKWTSDDGEKPDWCPLIEVPPHGRLIDADLVSKVLEHGAAEEWNQHAAPFSWSYAYECFNDTVDLIPTVIPADKDGET